MNTKRNATSSKPEDSAGKQCTDGQRSMESDARDVSGETNSAHWHDGLPESIGVLSAIAFAFATPAFVHFSIESFKQRDLLWLILHGIPISFAILLTIVGMVFGFRAYSRAFVVMAFVQIPLCSLIFFIMRLAGFWTSS